MKRAKVAKHIGEFCQIDCKHPVDGELYYGGIVERVTAKYITLNWGQKIPLAEIKKIKKSIPPYRYGEEI